MTDAAETYSFPLQLPKVCYADGDDENLYECAWDFGPLEAVQFSRGCSAQA